MAEAALAGEEGAYCWRTGPPTPRDAAAAAPLPTACRGWGVAAVSTGVCDRLAGCGEGCRFAESAGDCCTWSR